MKANLIKLTIIFIAIVTAILILHPELNQESKTLQEGLTQLWESLQAISHIISKMGESIAEIFKFLWDKYISNLL